MDDARFPDAAFRQPPVNHVAEMALLGALLSVNRCFDSVADFLRAEHFADPRHAAIYAAAGKLIHAGVTADAVTLRNHFEATGELDQLGGPEYLARLAGSIVSPRSAGDYGRAIHACALRRHAIDLAARLTDAAYATDIDTSPEDIIAGAQAEMGALLTEAVTTGPETLAQAAQRALIQAEAAYKDGTGIVGVPTHLTALDEKLGGLKPGEMIVIGARPGMGKTDLAINIAWRNASRPVNPKRVALFQLEMGAEQVATRILAPLAEHSAGLIARGRFNVQQFDRLADAARGFDKLPLYIDATPRLTVAQMAARARGVEPDLVIVDHLTLIPGEAPGQAYRGKVEQTAAVSGALKALSKTLKCPVLVLCQLSRDVEKRQGASPRPTLSDLRWAGEIEQDADAVLLLYRAEYYLKQVAKEDRDTEWQRKWDASAGTAEIILAKHRMGAGGTVKVAYDPALSRFGDLESAADDPPDSQSEMF